MTVDPAPQDTAGTAYAQRLQRLEGAWWKRMLDVQAPYRWNIHRLQLGRTLDVGCGLGRNLVHLAGDGVGVDHNPDSVAVARSRGLTAYTPAEFRSSPYARPGAFESMLLAHVLEHMPAEDGVNLIIEYLFYVRSGGRVVTQTPQERGSPSDPTHVRFVDFDAVERMCVSLGVVVQRRYSFPFPRWAGKVFAYNEFVVVAQKP